MSDAVEPEQGPEVEDVGRRLRELRKARNLTQSDLAQRIGIQQSDLCRMEKGRYRVRLDAGTPRAGRETELSFTVTRGGKPIRTQPYLGAGGHLVALREGDLAYLHVHP